VLRIVLENREGEARESSSSGDVREQHVLALPGRVLTIDLTRGVWTAKLTSTESSATPRRFRIIPRALTCIPAVMMPSARLQARETPKGVPNASDPVGPVRKPVLFVALPILLVIFGIAHIVLKIRWRLSVGRAKRIESGSPPAQRLHSG